MTRKQINMAVFITWGFMLVFMQVALCFVEWDWHWWRILASLTELGRITYLAFNIFVPMFVATGLGVCLED